MNNWRQRFKIVQKFGGGKTFYIIVDKKNPTWSVNMKTYVEIWNASSAAFNLFKTEQRKIEKILLGD